MMLKRIYLSALANTDIETINTEDLTEVSDVTFDMMKPYEERAGEIIKRLKNPYCFCVGNMGVKLEFSKDGLALQDVFSNFLKRQKSGLGN